MESTLMTRNLCRRVKFTPCLAVNFKCTNSYYSVSLCKIKITHQFYIGPLQHAEECKNCPTILGLHLNRINHNFSFLSTQTHQKITSNQINSIFLLLDDIFKLKSAKATALVIENKLRSLYYYYNNLNKEEKDELLKELATKYSVDHNSIMNASKQLAEMELDSGLMLKSEQKLRDLLTPQYSWLFSHLGRLDRGVKFLVDLRADILGLLLSTDVKSPHQVAIQQLNIALKELLSLWFSVGFLQLERITWSSPCSLLQKIAEYEAVQPVRSWVDIRRRVGPYRRCFVYKHHSMPGEPLVVLHVALTTQIADNMKNIIRLPARNDTSTDVPTQTSLIEEEPNKIKAFIFYSISSTQKGLQGIDLGNYMIKRAAKELHSEYPHVSKFSTLSPIPTFRQWLTEKIKAAEKGENVFPQHEWEDILNCINPEDTVDAWIKLRSMLMDNSWIHVESFVSALKDPLMASCSRYLYLEKRRGYAFDSVANFHLRNGAVMWRLNWMADSSPRGLSNSCGIMVNYRYYIDVADSNSLSYIQDRRISASEQITNLSSIT